MKRICIYVTLGLLGAVSAHAQEINIGQAVARKISQGKCLTRTCGGFID